MRWVWMWEPTLRRRQPLGWTGAAGRSADYCCDWWIRGAGAGRTAGDSISIRRRAAEGIATRSRTRKFTKCWAPGASVRWRREGQRKGGPYSPRRRYRIGWFCRWQTRLFGLCKRKSSQVHAMEMWGPSWVWGSRRSEADPFVGPMQKALLGWPGAWNGWRIERESDSSLLPYCRRWHPVEGRSTPFDMMSS